MHRFGTALVIWLILAMVPGEAGAQSSVPTEPATGVRLDVPAAGVGLTIPAGWSVWMDYRRADAPPGQPMPASERWLVLSAYEGSEVLDACRLFRYETSGLALEAFATALMTDQPSTLTPLRFDRAEAVRIDLDLGGPEVAQQWLVGADDTVVHLACLKGDGPPDARWLAMAESIEFLPEEE